MPKLIREAAGLMPGMALDIRVLDGRIEIEPAPREVKIVKKGRLAVAVANQDGEPLKTETVREAQDDLRKRR